MTRSVGCTVHAAVLALMLTLAGIVILLIDSERHAQVRDLTYPEFRRLLEYDRLLADSDRPLLLFQQSVRGRYRDEQGQVHRFRAFLPRQQRDRIEQLLRGRRLPYQERSGEGHLGAVGE
ncbi:MAG TPA: hypothetical protein VLU25_14505 [Acidobacteriota bacterium]|nr:hypothetical protein [Acidobacteriota bacterium]